MGRQVLPPGFRFHPTDEELVVHYLRKKAASGKCVNGVIGEIDLYKLEPWDLPEKSVLYSSDPEWYFFNARDKKYPHGSRTNRATGAGFWKATGKDRKVVSGGRMVGMKKTLVFYLGRAPKGERTDWIMHEYRLDEEYEKRMNNVSCFVLCRIHKKSGLGPRNGDDYGAAVLDEDDETVSPTECIMPEAANRKLPALCENETQQKCVDILNPVLTGCSETAPHFSTDVDSIGMEGSTSKDDLENFLQSLLSNESQDTDLNSGLETHIGLDSIPKQGPPKAQMESADKFTAVSDGGAVNCIKDTGSFKTMHLLSMETLPEVPSLVDLGVDGLDYVHDLLLSDPIEGEGLQTGGGDHGETLPMINNFMDQNVAVETDMVGDDYIELADLDHPLDTDFDTGFETHSWLDSGCKQGPDKVQMELADHFTAEADGVEVNCIKDTVSYESVNLPSTETSSEMPSLVDLGVDGLDYLHDFVHPDPSEAEILGEIWQTVGGGQGDTFPMMDNFMDQNVADETYLVGEDYIELADLDYPLDELDGFETCEEHGSPIYKDDDGIVASSHSRQTQEVLQVLHGQGPASQTATFHLASQDSGGIIDDTDTLQQVKGFYTANGQSPSSEIIVCLMLLLTLARPPFSGLGGTSRRCCRSPGPKEVVAQVLLTSGV